jgi:outer membrane protein OmpA-like peptidoglycan-associated protein
MRRRMFLTAAALPMLAGCEAFNTATGRRVENEPFDIVFFNENSATLEASAREVVRGAARSAASFPASRVNVFGYAGPAGGAAFNRELSDRRARHVADLLREFGIPGERIFVLPRGEVSFDLAPIESRRVEIRLARQ